MVDKKILVIIKFFYPDLTPCAFRFHGMLEFIAKNSNYKLTVITTLPHYRTTSKTPKAKYYEILDNIKIYRVKTPYFNEKLNNNAFFDIYIKNLYSDLIFMVEATLKAFSLKNFDILICSSPPLFAAFAGYIIAKIKKSKMILDIRDLWIEDKTELGLLNCKPVIILLKFIERIVLNGASAITCTSNGIKFYTEKKINYKKIEVITNGVDYENKVSIDPTFIKEQYKINKGSFLLLYAGKLGASQSLSSLIEGMKILSNYDVNLLIIGNGSDKKKIKSKIEEYNLKNVFLYPPAERALLQEFYSMANALLVHLKNIYPFFYTIPSKIYEYMVTDRPIIYGLQGEAKAILDYTRTGISFVPEDISSFVNAVLEVKENYNLYKEKIEERKIYVLSQYSRKVISAQFLNFINQI